MLGDWCDSSRAQIVHLCPALYLVAAAAAELPRCSYLRTDCATLMTLRLHDYFNVSISLSTPVLRALA